MDGESEERTARKLFTFVIHQICNTQLCFVNALEGARVTIIAEIFTLDYISNKRQWR